MKSNKMAIKLMFDGGPKGKRINTKKRVRLLLGLYENEVPRLFDELRNEKTRRDKFAKIDFVHLSNENGDVVVNEF